METAPSQNLDEYGRALALVVAMALMATTVIRAV
jgi:hypothetical protein